ncbi:S8 family serine peptidase [Modestobacter sp. VKM Ac-2986]|uniref:S8 family serine peptidase n=1 Tax=Modestobacter sp. VKM Ac-2986 TaxID=3004140 RepID=UPI0022AB7C00|nr:S8 family serine peptidase [Modestobacter sp. VKM Ac-2986]MCZ2830792.1 S8 family serine peptidase [Modestobacter sp. VKM Ac-2986]
MGTSPHLRGGTTASGRVKAVAVLAAAATGFGVAAAVDALALQDLPTAVTAADFGPAGDGLTRLVVSAVSDEQLAALQATPRVVSAQRLFDGSALVATEGLVPGDLSAVVPGAEVVVSEPGTVAAATISDPYWSTYGYNLLNTGTNSHTKPAVAGADVAAPTGWQAGTGRGTVVAVVDSGMMVNHPDLAGSLWTNPDEVCGSVDTDRNGLAGDCHGWNFYANTADVTNGGGDNSHGTSVAGAVGARAGNGTGTAGVAPDVTIMPLVVGSGQSVDVYAGAQAIRYAADNGADVVNASWGGNGGVQILTDAIRYANSKGVVVVVAAGNDANNRDAVPMYPASLDLENMVTVGASTPGDTIAGFSAYGARSVDLFAPGDLVFAPLNNGGYFLVSGTSIASPQVAAAFALYRAQHPDATPAQLKAKLFADTQPVPAFAGRSVTGGRLSLTALGNAAAEVRYTFTRMTAEAGVVSPQLAVSGTAPAGDYAVTLGLGLEHAGEVMAVADQALTLNGTTLRTGEDGQATFPLGGRPSLGSLVLSPTAELTDGRYVLLAQLRRDGVPVGRPYAAPLLVGAAAATPPPAGTAPSTAPSAAPTGSPAPGVPAPTTAPRTTTPATPTTSPRPTASGPGPVAPTAGPSPVVPPPAVPTTGTAPTSAAPPSGAPAPTGTRAPAAPTTAAPAPSVPAGPTSARPTSPTGAPQPPATAAPTPGPSGTTPPTAPTTAPPAGGTAPDTGGVKTYPQVGAAKLTSISPTRVDAAGGTRVTISGGAVPAGARVRVGLTAPATVTSASSSQVAFTTPKLVAGTYDVYVFAPDGTSSVLTAGLTYVSSTPAPPTTPAPTPTPTTQPSPSATPPGPVVTPGGQRLVRSPLFASLAPAVWKVNCSSACSGLAV